MTAFDLDRVMAETFVQSVEYREEVDSTNDLALEIVLGEPPPCPLLVLANRQTQGRGRGRNRWWAADGALTFTLVAGGPLSGLSARSGPQISVSAALAVGHSLLEVLPGCDVRLKWPNDVFLQSRKVSGILVESSTLRPNILLVGVGVNVNNPLSRAPAELQATATSLIDIAGRPFNRTGLLIGILNNLAQRFRQLERKGLQLSDNWRPLCLLQGRTVCIEAGATRLVGVCQGIDDEGALLLQTEAGVQRCFAGVVARIL